MTPRKLKSGNYNIKVFSHYEGEKRIYKSFTHFDKDEVLYLASEFKRNKQRYMRNDITIGEAMSKYIESKKNVLAPSTYREYINAIKRNYASIKDIRLNSITNQDIQLEISHYSSTHSPKSVRDMIGLLSATLNTYRSDFKLNVMLPQKTKPQLYIPTDKDITDLISASVGTKLYEPIILAAFCSMRRSEICALTVNDIKNNRININKALVKNSHNEWVIKTTKTTASTRIADLPKSFNFDGYFPDFNPNYITKHFNKLLRDNNIPHFRFHDLRHYYVSISHALGIPDAYIMNNGGWASDRTMKNVYRHIIDEKESEFTALFNTYCETLCNTKP